ncbi:hypothetical protein NDU88_001705 [Pleurodeles waltl]|uniref:Uncharacterized protein n=1 Tax=Pleurodeles waltl TaxID=8319 RepID=A0AAV7WLD1_PLEWA|nr:hypothetical protein NDU88_001705 [Pleurodeles waltl]
MYAEADQLLRRHDYNYHLMRLQAEGDRSGRLLAWLLREDRQHTQIRAIRLIDRTMGTSQEAINNAFKEYGMGLYRGQATCDTQRLEAFLCGVPFPKLSALNVAALDEPLKLEEIVVATAQIAHNKTQRVEACR